MSKYRLTLIATLLMLIFVSCGKVKETEEKEESLPEDIVELRDDQMKLAGISTGAIEMRTMSGTIKVNGTISVAPQNLATVCMPMGGFVKSISLVPGSPVRKGQTLAVIENQEFIDIQLNYIETKNKLEYAEAEYKRHMELYKDDVYSQKNLQQVTTEYKNLKGLANALEQKLAIIGINIHRLTEDNISRSVALVSPISGYIKTANVSIGKSVASSDVLFEIVNTDNLFLELDLFEKDVEKVTNGAKISFLVNNETEQHEAVVYQTGKSINNDKSYKVYANVTGHCKNLMPGMYVSAFIKSIENRVTAVPSESIVSFDDKDYIFVFDKNKTENGNKMTEYRIVQVKKGITDNGYTEITLPEDIHIETTKLIIKGAYNLLSAMKNAGEMSC